MTEAVKEKPLPTGEELTFEKLRAMFQDIAERQKETDRQIKEDAKITSEMIRKTERIVKQNSRQMGGLHRSFGEMAEHLVAPGIERRFNEFGYHFSETAPKGHKIKDEKGRILTEIDILLENGETVIVVEVKARPELEDIDHHVKRLEILRESRKKINEKRNILGAIAGAIYEDEVKEAVSDAGFFVIEQSGDTMKIDMPEGWVPRCF
jgi:predicted AAA+ superfamily ATPase